MLLHIPHRAAFKMTAMLKLLSAWRARQGQDNPLAKRRDGGMARAMGQVSRAANFFFNLAF